MRPARKLGDSRCQCSGCGEYFNSDGAFDKHRVGQFNLPKTDPNRRRCMSVPEMLAAGMALNADKWWITKPYDGPVHTSGDAQDALEPSG